jgi:hypothetical protein
MSQENVDVVRRFEDLVAGDDARAAAGGDDEDVAFRPFDHVRFRIVETGGGPKA